MRRTGRLNSNLALKHKIYEHWEGKKQMSSHFFFFWFNIIAMVVVVVAPIRPFIEEEDENIRLA